MSADTFAATIRLGTKLSVGAVVLAVALSLLGDVTQWSYVAAVAVLGAVLSWNQSAESPTRN